MKILFLNVFLFSLLLSFKIHAQYDFPEWQEEKYKAANTSEGASYLSPEEKDIITLLNYARMNGKLFAETYVKKYAELKKLENLKQVKSLIVDLSKTKPLQPYVP
ncbi:MAG TPA: hypothetical protein VK766_11950, partial [Cytophagaceae bacterium]|nr:hypothetical protein [Cytophagaceae bacterium]